MVRTKKVVKEAIAECVTDVLTTAHLDVLCDLLLNRRTATWNLFVSYNNASFECRNIIFSVNFITRILCLVFKTNLISIFYIISTTKCFC